MIQLSPKWVVMDREDYDKLSAAMTDSISLRNQNDHQSEVITELRADVKRLSSRPGPADYQAMIEERDRLRTEVNELKVKLEHQVDHSKNMVERNSKLSTAVCHARQLLNSL